MNETALAAREALWVALQVGGPLLLLLLAVGLVIAVLQALTQVNEATLAFLPKVVVLAGALAAWLSRRASKLRTSSASRA